MKLETSLSYEKSALRKSIRARRRSLVPSEKQRLDSAIRQHLTTCLKESKPTVVAAFWPFDGEPDLRPVMAVLDQKGITVALPVIRESASMIFRQWQAAAPMVDNRYGIPEPSESVDIPVTRIDLLLLPLVAWDKHGGRLGMGAGFYDRALQQVRHLQTPLRVGVAFRLQEVDRLPTEPWDVHLHGVLSETGWLACSPSLKN